MKRSTWRRRLVGVARALTVLILPVLVSGNPLMAGGQAQEEDLNVFWKWAKWNHPGGLLIEHLISEAEVQYAARDRKIAALRTREDWLVRQESVKALLQELLGPFPQKSALNPRITGILRRPEYRVEKVVYESMPGFHVSGCLFVPEGRSGRLPAILNVIGHNQDAFRDDLYQILYLNLVKKGFVVLAIDPIGQGEKVQYFDPQIGFSSVGYTVIEHCYFGNQCFLAGSSPARYFTWDGIRGIDYLVSRDEVDPERIGVTGFSGGGTVTSYIAAVDDRVNVAVACSWSTASRRLTESKGTQDAESFLVHGLAKGISFEDLVEVRAPKPTLLTFTSRDEYLSIQGAREAYREIAGAYRAFGAEDRLAFSEDDDKHWMTPSIRTSIYAFFQKHLRAPGESVEEEVEIIPKKDLQVTPTGQLTTWLNGETVFSLNRREAEALIRDLEASRKDPVRHLERARSEARRLSGFRDPEATPGVPLFNGQYRREGYSLGRYLLPGEGDTVVPMLLFSPLARTSPGAAVVYLHPIGMNTDAVIGGPIDALVQEGFVVAAADVLGVGQTKNTVTRALADDYTAVNIARSTVGLQAGDIVRIVRYLKGRPEIDPSRIGGVAIDEMGIPLLHAAAFAPEIKALVLSGSPVSYRSIAMNRFYRIGLIPNPNGGFHHPYEVDFAWGVAGALKAYDLPDLIASLAPRKVVLAGVRDERLAPAPDPLIAGEMAFPREVYSRRQAAGNLRIVPASSDLGPLVSWAVE